MSHKSRKLTTPLHVGEKSLHQVKMTKRNWEEKTHVIKEDENHYNFKEENKDKNKVKTPTKKKRPATSNKTPWPGDDDEEPVDDNYSCWPENDLVFVPVDSATVCRNGWEMYFYSCSQ